jgi:hypothetical protein
MEHADDIMLELAGICDRDRVTLGGVVDTRNSQKPSVPTSKLPIAHSFEGKSSTHTFTLGDATSMKANVSPQLERLFDFRFEILDFRF